MALKREQAQTRYATKISVNRGTGFSSLANAYNKRSESFDQLTDAYAKTVLDEIQTQGKKIGQDAAENVKFVNELVTREQPDGSTLSFTTRKPVEEYTPRTRSEQDAYEKELSQRYVLEIRKLGRQQVREKAAEAKENYRSHDEFDDSIQPILEALLADLPDNVRNLASTYIEEDRHQSWISVMDNKRRYDEQVQAVADEQDISLLISEVGIGSKSVEEAKQEISTLHSNSLYYQINKAEIESNIDSLGYFKSKTDGLFVKDPADMTLEELSDAAEDAQKINLVLRGTGGTTLTLSNGQTITGEEAITNINQKVRQDLITEHTAKNASYAAFASDREINMTVGAIYTQNRGDASVTQTAKYSAIDTADLIKYISNVPEEVISDFTKLVPYKENDSENINNNLYNADGTINKGAVLVSPQYAAFTIQEFGQVSSPMKNILTQTADAPSTDQIEFFINSGLGDTMFEKYELIRAKNGLVTAQFHDASGHIDLPRRVTNALRFMFVQSKVGLDPEEIAKKLSERTKDRLENPQKYTFTELIKSAGGPLEGQAFINQIYSETKEVLQDIARAYYAETEEGQEAAIQMFSTSSYATPVTSVKVQRLLEDHIYDVLEAGNPINSNADIKREISKYMNGLIKHNDNFGFSNFHWSQDGVAFQTGELDFKNVSATGTLAMMPFEKQMAINGDIGWAIDMVDSYIKRSDLYAEGYLKDENARFGGRIRVDPLDYTSPARYALIHIDTDGTIRQLQKGGIDIIIDAETEKQKYIQKFRPDQEPPEYNYDITRQFQ